MAPAEQLRKDPRPWVVATAFSHRPQRAQVEQAEALGLLERTLEATARFDGREIPQGPLMAGKRRRSARERGRQVAPERGHASVADREDTLAHAVQPADAQPVADRRRSVARA